ncbi:hypothetical protein THAOC_23668, partial [Thalassiosira oceanica]
HGTRPAVASLRLGDICGAASSAEEEEHRDLAIAGVRWRRGAQWETWARSLGPWREVTGLLQRGFSHGDSDRKVAAPVIGNCLGGVGGSPDIQQPHCPRYTTRRHRSGSGKRRPKSA